MLNFLDIMRKLHKIFILVVGKFPSYLSEGILSDSQETENTETLEGSVRILSESLDILKDSIAIRDQAITVLQSRVTECLGDPRGGFRLL